MLLEGQFKPSTSFVPGELTLGNGERRVKLTGRPVQLAAMEYELLFQLSTNANRLLTYDRLRQLVWTCGSPTTGPVGCQLHRGGKELNTLSHPDQAVVTGAFGYTGRYVAQRQLDEGVTVRALTLHSGSS